MPAGGGEHKLFAKTTTRSVCATAAPIISAEHSSRDNRGMEVCMITVNTGKGPVPRDGKVQVDSDRS